LKSALELRVGANVDRGSKHEKWSGAGGDGEKGTNMTKGQVFGVAVWGPKDPEAPKDLETRGVNKMKTGRVRSGQPRKAKHAWGKNWSQHKSHRE